MCAYSAIEHFFVLLQEQLHVDLIRFSPAVIIHEVRIVPQEKMVHNELEIIGWVTI